MLCVLCETRRPRRFCPGVRGEICSLCCGQEREVTVSCPFDCEYLQEARLHERPPELKESDFPNRDIPVTEHFLAENEELVVMLGRALVDATLQNPDIIDNDVREGLEALIRTYRTLQSGLYYESRPANPMAAFVYDHVQRVVTELRQMLQQAGRAGIRDVTVLGVLAFLQRTEMQNNNGRRKGRAFLDFLRQNLMLGPPPEEPPAPSLIVP
ncbi:MAG: hypothetical protein NTY38_16870 [Acidobacteria bacterium]|nr:hypothetical protein [Acidobacteriota bacterium]